jgi:uncharacterized membrane protein
MTPALITVLLFAGFIIWYMHTMSQAQLRNFSETSSRQAKIINDIHALLDGKEWSPDTLDRISGILLNAGYKIRSPERIASE